MLNGFASRIPQLNMSPQIESGFAANPRQMVLSKLTTDAFGENSAEMLKYAQLLQKQQQAALTTGQKTKDSQLDFASKMMEEENKRYIETLKAQYGYAEKVLQYSVDLQKAYLKEQGDTERTVLQEQTKLEDRKLQEEGQNQRAVIQSQTSIQNNQTTTAATYFNKLVEGGMPVTKAFYAAQLSVGNPLGDFLQKAGGAIQGLFGNEAMLPTVVSSLYKDESQIALNQSNIERNANQNKTDWMQAAGTMLGHSKATLDAAMSLEQMYQQEQDPKRKEMLEALKNQTLATYYTQLGVSSSILGQFTATGKAPVEQTVTALPEEQKGLVQKTGDFISNTITWGTADMSEWNNLLFNYRNIEDTTYQMAAKDLLRKKLITPEQAQMITKGDYDNLTATRVLQSLDQNNKDVAEWTRLIRGNSQSAAASTGAVIAGTAQSMYGVGRAISGVIGGVAKGLFGFAMKNQAINGFVTRTVANSPVASFFSKMTGKAPGQAADEVVGPFSGINPGVRPFSGINPQTGPATGINPAAGPFSGINPGARPFSPINPTHIPAGPAPPLRPPVFNTPGVPAGPNNMFPQGLAPGQIPLNPAFRTGMPLPRPPSGPGPIPMGPAGPGPSGMNITGGGGLPGAMPPGMIPGPTMRFPPMGLTPPPGAPPPLPLSPRFSPTANPMMQAPMPPTPGLPNGFMPGTSMRMPMPQIPPGMPQGAPSVPGSLNQFGRGVFPNMRSLETAFPKSPTGRIGSEPLLDGGRQVVDPRILDPNLLPPAAPGGISHFEGPPTAQTVPVEQRIEPNLLAKLDQLGMKDQQAMEEVASLTPEEQQQLLEFLA